MKFTVDNKEMSDALSTIAKLSPPTSGHVTIAGTKQGITIYSLGDLNKASIKIPLDIQGKSEEFGVDLQALTSAIRARGEITLHYSKSLLNIQAGRYKATLSTFDPLQETDKITTKVKGHKIDVETAAYLRDAARTVALAPDPLLSSFTPMGVRATSKGTNVVCYDSYHSALSSSKAITGDFSFVVPSTVLITVLDVFYVSEFRLQVTESSLLVANSIATVEIGLPVMEENLTLDQVLKALEGLIKSKARPFVVNKDELSAFLDNSKAVATKERMALECEVNKNRLRVKTSNINGTVQAIIPTKGKDCKFSVNLAFVTEAVSKAGSDVPITLINSNSISVATPKAIFIMATNQE